MLNMSFWMFVVTTFIGLIPDKINADKRVMDIISIIGAGLLIGAAFSAVIPEGIVQVMTSVYEDGSTDEELMVGVVEITVGIAMISGFIMMLLLDAFISIYKAYAQERESALMKNEEG